RVVLEVDIAHLVLRGRLPCCDTDVHVRERRARQREDEENRKQHHSPNRHFLSFTPVGAVVLTQLFGNAGDHNPVPETKMCMLARFRVRRGPMTTNRRKIGAIVLALSTALPCVAQTAPTGQKSLAATLNIYAFPQAGQAADQQSKDEAECYDWAVKQTARL